MTIFRHRFTKENVAIQRGSEGSLDLWKRAPFCLFPALNIIRDQKIKSLLGLQKG